MIGDIMEIVSTSQTEKALLGEGYNIKEERFAGECVMGTPIYTGAPEAAIQYERSMSQTEMADSLGFEAKAKARYGLISGSLSAKFASESSANDFSEVSVYSAQYKFKNVKLQYTGLTPVGKKAKGSSSESDFTWENWEKTCGHEYVSEVVQGASLFYSIKVEFATRADKESFNAEFSLKAPMLSAGGTLNKASEKFGSRGLITIRAYQLGGDVAKLSQALGAEVAADGQNVSALINCSMEDPGACLAVLDRAIDYATNEFPLQIKPDYNPSSPAGPADMVYLTRPWEELALYPPPPLIAEGVRVARQDLAFQFEQNLKYRTRVRALQTGKILLSPRQQDNIERIDDEVSQNFSLINEAAEVCYTEMDKCVAKVDEVKGKLTSFHPEDFDIYPESFSQWYSIKELPDTDKDVKHTVNTLVEMVRAEVNNFDQVQDKAKTAENVLNSLPSLSLISKNIKDFRPLSTLTNLPYLSIYYNPIPDLSSLSTLTKLTSLWLLYDQISDLSAFSVLKNLAQLNFEGNQIKDVSPLADLVKLTYLNLYNNQVTDISALGSLKALTHLNLNHNQIVDISALSALTDLTDLRLSSNQIRDLSALSSLKALNFLDIKDNPVENITALSSLSNLTNLFVSANQISVLEGPNLDWQGTWTRRNQSNVFDAYWIRPQSGAEARDVIEVTALGVDKVTLFCPGYGGRTYHGSLSADHQAVVSGTADYSSGYRWSATIKAA
jgi:hypothetical protein